MKRQLKDVLAIVAVVCVVFGLCVLSDYLIRIRDISYPESNILEPDYMTFPEQVQESIKGVVHLQCPRWQGSGFVVGPRLIATARHCVEDVTSFTVTTHTGCQVHATRAISDKEHDVAFIWVDDLTCVAEPEDHNIPMVSSDAIIWVTNHEVVLHPLPLCNIKDCRLGQNVYVIGSPYGQVNFNNLTTGIISGVNRDWSQIGGAEDYGWKVAFTVDSAGHPGNSGCPVFTSDGVVRGILVGSLSPVLISVMPCDLFLGDLESIRLMFMLDRYEREEAPEYDPYHNYGLVVESEDRGQEGYE
jgi:S1-C subfamily serine protease